MPTSNHNIRIYVPFNATTKKPDTSSNGHYDLHLADSSFNFLAYQIGDDVTLTDPQAFTFNNPVISYGGIPINGVSEGYITIKNLANMTNRQNHLLCNCPFSGTDAGKAVLKTWLTDYVRYDPLRSNNTEKRFKVIHTSYNVYSANSSNCFMVTGLFCSFLGYSTLLNISNSTSDYHNYTAWPMFIQYKGYWKLVNLNLT